MTRLRSLVWLWVAGWLGHCLRGLSAPGLADGEDLQGKEADAEFLSVAFDLLLMSMTWGLMLGQDGAHGVVDLLDAAGIVVLLNHYRILFNGSTLARLTVTANDKAGNKASKSTAIIVC